MAVAAQDTKISCISWGNQWSKLFFNACKSAVNLSYFNNFCIRYVRNEYGLLGPETLKSSVSQEWIDEMSWFVSSWYKFRKAKSCFNNYLVGVVKNEWALIDHGTLNLGVAPE